ncbi:MAG: hypothetical protein ACRDPY_44485 [Streptosporangiaceae bacterium]
MRRQLRWYGASPLHLLALLACFGLAGYAAARLIPSQPLGVAAWFLGAVIGHDLLLMPLYSLADRSVMAAIRHREPPLPVTPWINYVRVPAALSGLLLLVWFPLILRLQSPYHASTTLSANPYVWHWLAVTGALFLLSAVAFALRLRGTPRAASPPKRPAAAPGAGPDVEGGHETDSGHPGQSEPGQGQPPAILEEREPEQDACELAPAEGDARQESPESSSGRPQPAAEHPDPPSPVLHPSASPQHETRPADMAPDAE